MARKSLWAYAIQRAVDVLGGVAQVAKQTGISQTRLRLYLGGLEPVPEAVFLRIADILAHDAMTKLSKGMGPARSGRDGREAGRNNGKKNGNGKRAKE